jgi:hypothetical protein
MVDVVELNEYSLWNLTAVYLQGIFRKKSMPPYGFKYYLNWLRAKLNLQALILVAGFYAFLWL